MLHKDLKTKLIQKLDRTMSGEQSKTCCSLLLMVDLLKLDNQFLHATMNERTKFN